MPTRPPTHRAIKATACNAIANQQHDNRPGRQFYRTERWKRASAAFRKRHPICATPGCGRASQCVDHVKPHQGDYEKFWNPLNWQALCDPCHSTKTAMEDGGFGRAIATKVYVVAGPPGSGKTTYVQQHKEDGDLVVDLDAIITSISGLPTYEDAPNVLPFALAARDAIIRQLSQPSPLRAAWIIGCYPRSQERNALRQRLGAKVIVLDVPADECLRRIEQQLERKARHEDWTPIVEAWHRDYQACDGDNVFTYDDVTVRQDGVGGDFRWGESPPTVASPRQVHAPVLTGGV